MLKSLAILAGLLFSAADALQVSKWGFFGARAKKAKDESKEIIIEAKDYVRWLSACAAPGHFDIDTSADTFAFVRVERCRSYADNLSKFCQVDAAACQKMPLIKHVFRPALKNAPHLYKYLLKSEGVFAAAYPQQYKKIQTTDEQQKAYVDAWTERIAQSPKWWGKFRRTFMRRFNAESVVATVTTSPPDKKESLRAKLKRKVFGNKKRPASADPVQPTAPVGARRAPSPAKRTRSQEFVAAWNEDIGTAPKRSTFDDVEDFLREQEAELVIQRAARQATQRVVQ